MGGLSRFSPKPDFKPAGYLPAPQQARFISEAEQAAEKLPATIKSQSLKNALLKGGAKPLELEYAGIDDFISQNQGKPVSAADVLSHLRTEGPLGKLKRVEQQVVGGSPENQDDSPLTWDEQVEVGVAPTPPAYAEDVRAPFDPSFASDQTRYHEYTVPGKRGDFTGYREVLLEDPKNSKSKIDRLVPKPKPTPNPGDVDTGPEAQAWMAHATGQVQHLDAADVEHAQDSIQHIVDQAEARGMRLGYSDDGVPFFEFAHRMPERFEQIGPVDSHRADYWTRYNEYPDRIAVQNVQSDVGQDYTKNGKVPELDEAGFLSATDRARELDQKSQRWGLNNEEMQELRRLDQAIAEYEHKLPVSPLAKDGNWKNLMARHIALQSINGGGKPITIPTGKQMVDVEGFGMETHEDRDLASKAAGDFNTDLVRRLQKIFRGLHPDGASVMEHFEVTPTTPLSTYADSYLSHAIGQGRGDLRRLLAQAGGGGSSGYFKSVDKLKDSNSPDLRVLETIMKSGRGDSDVNYATGVQRLKGSVYDDLSPEFRDAAMRVIQQHYLNKERGLLAPPPPPPADAPGWTIKPSPMAVRQALEKGLPIMSLAPLLLSPQQEQR